MAFTTDQSAQIKRTLLLLSTIALWLATVALGFWAMTTIQEAVDAQVLANNFQKIQDQEMGLTTGSGVRRLANYATIFIGVMVWMGVVIGGMEYHFRRIGKRNSYVVFAVTLGIELALVVVGNLLQIA